MHHRIRLLLALAVLIGTLTGCHPTSNVARCDNLLAGQEETIANMGGWLRCDPSYDPDEPANAQMVVQWDIYNNGQRVPVVWLWDRRLDDRFLRIDAYEGSCEVYNYLAGRVPDWWLNVQRWGVPAAVEQDCFSWAVAQP